MVIRDGEGAFIDFEWPSLWYLVKAGFAATLGVFIASVVLMVPASFLLSGLLTALLRGFGR